MNDPDKSIKDEIKAGARAVTERTAKPKFNGLGLCGDCTNRQVFKTEFGSIFAKCSEFGRRLNSNDPVSECSLYWRETFYSLDDFMRMATLIDLHRKIGFTPHDYEDW